MKILKQLGEIFKMAFVDDVKIVSAFSETVFPKKNYQKEIAQNTKQISNETNALREDFRQELEHLNK